MIRDVLSEAETLAERAVDDDVALEVLLNVIRDRYTECVEWEREPAR